MKRFLRGVGPSVRSLSFVFLLAAIMVVGSERIFWFWTPSLGAHLEGTGFYMIATAVGFLLMRRFHVSTLWSLLLISPVVAYVVEGVLTPIVYTGGPFVPFFPAWFAFWHGAMSFVFMIFVVRRWLLDAAIGRLGAAAIGLGAFWAAWASTLRLPENVEDPEMVTELGTLTVLEPTAFAIYAVTFTAVLLFAHAALGFVWPTAESTPTRFRGLTVGEWLAGGLVAAGVVGWTVVVFWALPMFVLYTWVQYRGLQWHEQARRGGASTEPDQLESLRGHIPVRALVPLTLLAPAAAIGYAAIWHLDPSDDALRIVMYSLIGAQTIAGLGLSIMALRRARRASQASQAAPIAGAGNDAYGLTKEPWTGSGVRTE